MGIEVFKSIPTDAPLVVAEAVWQYSHHVLAGLRTHRGPDPHRRELGPAQCPGLVGLLEPQRQPDQDGQALLHAVERSTSPTSGRATG